MFTSNWTFLMNVLPVLIILIELKCAFSMPRQRYRIYRSKGSGPPPFPPFLSISPPRMASAQNFHSDYAVPPFLMNGPPNSGYTHPPIMDYAMDHPNGLQLEYGPPSTTSKPVIHKHVFVHIPPPEPEEPIMRPPLTTVAPQKHYRIVFIKAPTEAPVTYPTIPLQPPDEEKTLVYVLVKKPDPPPELVLPKPVSTVPTKPEVYFIRYKSQKEENEGPYPASNSNSNSNPTTNNYPPNTSYGPPPSSSNAFTTTSAHQTNGPTLGPPLAAYMINSKPLKSKYNNNNHNNNRIINSNHIYS